MSLPVVLLASGGLDSTTLAHWLVADGYQILPVFFDYGQHCANTEWKTLNSVLPRRNTGAAVRLSLRDVFTPSYSRLVREADLWSESIDASELYIPYRTLLFFTAAAAYAQSLKIETVYSGFINSNHATEMDCSAEFLNRLDALAEHVGPVRFRMPFRYNTKQEVVEMALRLEVPLGRTFSCQVWHDVPCGACPNCADRLDALRAAGLLQSCN